MMRFPRMGREFPKVDQAALPADIPAEWQDNSHGSHSAPHFIARELPDGSTVNVWVLPKGRRVQYTVQHENASSVLEVIYVTDEWEEAQAAVANFGLPRITAPTADELAAAWRVIATSIVVDESQACYEIPERIEQASDGVDAAGHRYRDELFAKLEQTLHVMYVDACNASPNHLKLNPDGSLKK